MEFVRAIANVNRHDVALAGGKAANLGELVQAKLPVPPGFVLLTSAYVEGRYAAKPVSCLIHARLQR